MKRTGPERVRGGEARALVFAAAVVLVLGCSPPRARAPLETLSFARQGAAGHRLLIVFLPGNGDAPGAFERRGLVAAVRKRGVPADMIAVNAHLGYYLNGSFILRLRTDVIEPAQAQGYERIWLVGNSLGAYGSLAYLGAHRADVAGVVLLGPFIGDRAVLDEVRQAGGLEHWDPGSGEPTEWQKGLMLLLKDYQRHPDDYPPIYLGFGSKDRFSPSQRFLAGMLPAGRVLEVQGGHEWWTWSALWDRFLDQGILR